MEKVHCTMSSDCVWILSDQLEESKEKINGGEL